MFLFLKVHQCCARGAKTDVFADPFGEKVAHEYKKLDSMAEQM